MIEESSKFYAIKFKGMLLKVFSTVAGALQFSEQIDGSTVVPVLIREIISEPEIN